MLEAQAGGLETWVLCKVEHSSLASVALSEPKIASIIAMTRAQERVTWQMGHMPVTYSGIVFVGPRCHNCLGMILKSICVQARQPGLVFTASNPQGQQQPLLGQLHDASQL